MYVPIPPYTFKCEPCAYWEGFFTDEELVKILALPEWSATKKASVGDTVHGSVNYKTRISDVAWLEIYDKIANTIARVNSEFFRFELTGMHEAIQLGIYSGSENGHYEWHCDEGGKSAHVYRKLSMALLLTDPNTFEGGQLQLKYDTDEVKTVEQKKGRAWFFPSYTLHRVAPVTKGVRKSLVVWVEGPKFK